MRALSLFAFLLVLLAPLGGCSRRLHERDVREFIDKADDAARKRFAPEICALRGKDFTLHLTFHGQETDSPTEVEMNRKLFCKQAGTFSRLRVYHLERKSIEIDLASDRRSARVVSSYVETLPYYEPDTMPVSPDYFRDYQVIDTRDDSLVGFEGGDLVFLSSDSESHQKLVPRNSPDIPFN